MSFIAPVNPRAYRADHSYGPMNAERATLHAPSFSSSLGNPKEAQGPMRESLGSNGAARVGWASVSLLLALMACGEEEPPPITVPDGAAWGDIFLEPCTYEVPAASYEAECGTFVVPENRSDPDSRLIVLPVTRVPATGSEPAEPLFYLEGGPGVSNTYFSRLERLVERHDIVLVGYRGIDGSVVLDCPEITQAFENMPDDLLSAASLTTIADAYARCGERLHDEGVDTDGYTMMEVVDDMEEARIALGYERIHLLSESYGTRLALIYAWRYPQSIHRSVMIGVNPPGHFVWNPDVIDRQLEYYSELCDRDLECRSRTDDLAETMREVARNMPARWLVFPIKRDNVLAGTFMLLYHTATARAIFDTWLAAADGDYSGFALLSKTIDLMLPNASVWGESAAKATSADYAIEPGRDYVAEMSPPHSIIGSPASALGWGAAAGWPSKLIPGEYRQVQPSDVETLLISGSVDFSTPAEAATEELLPHLTNGHQVILREFGHTGDVWTLQPEATKQLLVSYFDTGTVDESLFAYQPMDFHVGLGLPDIAKLIVIGFVVSVLVVAVVMWLVYRLIRKRRKKKPVIL